MLRHSSSLSVLLGAAMLACATLAMAAPRHIALLVGDTLDEHGRAKPMAQWQRKLLDDVEHELDIVFDIRMVPWPRAELNAINGAGLVFGLPKTAERLRVLRYSDIAAINNLWLVTRSDATFEFNGIEDLRGKRIGAVRGFSYGEEFERARGTLFQVDDEISSRAARLSRLMLRRVDVVLLYQANGQGVDEIQASINSMMQEPLKAIKAPANVHFAVLPKPLVADNGVYFAIARDKDDGIIARINAALARLRKAAMGAKRIH